jgi:hypothetical protein
MRTRRWLWLLLPLALGLLAWVLCTALQREPPVSRARFDTLRPGMPLAEVLALLGGPPGDYRTGAVVVDVSGGMPEFDNVMLAPKPCSAK